ncbi:hypothetical protein SprV_0200738000 [Sparganum proliferum]
MDHRIATSKMKLRPQLHWRSRVAAAAADESSSVENRWCQIRDTVQSTALVVLGSARRQLQDCFDDNDADIRNLLAEKNGLQKPYAAYCPKARGTAPLHSFDVITLLTEKTQVLQRRDKHFRDVLSCLSNISYSAIARLPQVETNADLDLPPSLHETIRTVQQRTSCKAPGSDAIPAEIYIFCCLQIMKHLTALF